MSQDLLPLATPHPTLSPADEALHPLMRHAVRGYQSRDNALKRFGSGAVTPFGAARLLLAHPKLWPWAIAPALINLLLFLGLLWFTLPLASGWFSALWSAPVITAWYHYALTALWWVIYLVAMAMTTVLTYMSAMVVGGVVASPFNDELSQRTEKLLLGERYVPPPEEPFVPALIRSALSSAAMAGLYVGVMVPLLLLNLIPVVGSVAYTLIGGVAGGYFVALEYCDTVLERRGLPFREKLETVWRERSLSMGFGIGMSLMMAIPIVNFLCLPLAVISGTTLGLAILDSEPTPEPPLLDSERGR